ncbi:MAG: GDSL-type esterase/lipase family protein, partial [Alphaproteobacteria bacterium]|nr:GDSL-type esterase/lipase family protein [Alphaproteobacteria bacterium]
MTRRKAIAANLCLVVGSVAVFFLLLELVVFRFVLPATDVPQNAFIDGTIRLEPHQQGYTRSANGRAARYVVNAQGWNSAHPTYRPERVDGEKRIALIGDSFVEALQVPYDESLAERLESRMIEAGQPTEVYRFAVSGAPLSQYLHMLEQEVARYAPDLVIVVIVHNDFDESFLFKPGRYTSSFLKLKMEGDRVVDELAPAPFEPGWIEMVRHLATFRYLYYQRKLRPSVIRDLLLGSRQVYEANIEVDRITRHWDQIAAATDYLFARLAASAARQGTKLMLVMDANRQEIYHTGRPAKAHGADRLNGLAADLAAKHGIPFLDLKSAFRADWATHKTRFEFPDDNHWNSYGHDKAAEAITAFLEGQQHHTLMSG